MRHMALQSRALVFRQQRHALAAGSGLRALAHVHHINRAPPARCCADRAQRAEQKYTKELLQAVGESLTQRYADAKFAESLVLLTEDIHDLAEAGCGVPEELLERVFKYVAPPTDGSFQFEFMRLLSALSLLQATPPTAWLHRLDIALLAYCADSDNLRFDASALQPSVCGQALELALRVQQQQAQQVKLQAQGAADAGSSGRGGGGTEAGVGGSSGGGRSLPGAPMATRLSPGAAWTAPPPLFPLLIEAGLMEQGLLLLPEQDGQGTSAGAGAGAGAGRTAPAAPSGTTPSSTSTSTSTPLATSPSHAQDWADLLPGVEAFHQLLQAGEPPLWRRYLARRDLPWQMLGPLLRRYGDNMGMQEVAAVARVAVMAIDEQCMAGGMGFAEAQAYLMRAMELGQALCEGLDGTQQAGQEGEGTQPGAGYADGGQQLLQGQPTGPSPAVQAGMALLDMCEATLGVAAHLYYQGGMYGTLGSAVTQQLVAAARTACDTLERAGAGPACESLPLLQVDSMYCGTDHPATLVHALVLLARSPSADYRTPGKAVAVLSAHLDWFTDGQLLDALQALGRLGGAGPGPGAGQHSSANSSMSGGAAAAAANAPGLSSTSGTFANVAAAMGASQPQQPPQPPRQQPPPWVEALTNSGAARTLRKASSLPDDLQDYLGAVYPSMGPACDEDPNLDLLSRIGLRLSRGLAAQTPAQQARTLAQLGLGLGRHGGGQGR